MNKIFVAICFLVVLGGNGKSSFAKGRDYRLDSELFRRGLIERGLDDWLKLYDQQHPPMSDIDLLAEQIANAWLKYRRTKNPKQRTKALNELLDLELDRVESYPSYPLSPVWRVRLAADLLNEKYGAQAFIVLLDLHLPANYRKEFIEGLTKIEGHLDKAQKVLKERLNKFKELNGAKLEKINRQGLTGLYLTAMVQAKYLRGWCWYHRLRLMKDKSPEQVKLLYQLSSLLKQLDTEITPGLNAGLKLIEGSAERLLGNYRRADILLGKAEKDLSGSYRIFAYIEQALVAMEEDKPARVEMLIKQGRKSAGFYRNDVDRYALVNLALTVIESRAKLAQLTEGERCDRQIRNKVWSKLISILEKNPQYGELVFSKLVSSGRECQLNALADVELYARAKYAMGRGKVPLAESMLKQLVARKGVSEYLKERGAILLAGVFEKQGEFAKAAKIVGRSIGNDGNGKNCELVAEAARLSWLALQAKPSNSCREEFIRYARELINKCPESRYADRFKLLMADQLCDDGKFNEALQWIEQVPAGSEFYLQSRAERVLVLTRQFNASAASGSGEFMKSLADEIVSACKEMLTIASAGQRNPNSPKSWQLTPEQVQIIGASILATVNVLTNANIARADEANRLLSKYKPILQKYEKSSNTAVVSQIVALLKQWKNADDIKQAIGLAEKLFAQKIDESKKLDVIIAVLEVVHQYMLWQYAEPISKPTGLTDVALNLADMTDKKLSADKMSLSQRAKFFVIYGIIACDGGEYERAEKLFGMVPKIPKRYEIDVKLAKARIAFYRKQYMLAARLSMYILQRLSSADIRYWQGLVVNLSSHLKLGSEPAQIASAILARQTEYPEMGSKATKSQLMKILKIAQSRISAKK